MRSFTALFLPLLACGEAPKAGAFDVKPVTLLQAPCGAEPDVPSKVPQGAEVRVPLRSTRADATFTVVTFPAGAEAFVDGGVLVYRAGFETLGRDAVVEVAQRCGAEARQFLVSLPVEPSIRWGTPFQWAADAGPDAREHPILYLDEAEPNVLWLFGGFSFVPRQFTVTNDVWRLDLLSSQWEQVPAMGAPTLAAGRATRGERPGEMWLVGGQPPNNGTPVGDIYRVRLNERPVTFEKLAVASNAPPLTLGTVVHDVARRRLVAFGGFTGSIVSSSLHTLPLEAMPRWSTVPTTGPSPRYGFFWAVDGDELLVFSGAQVGTASDPINAAKDTWSLALPTLRWTKVADATPDAPGRRNGCSAFDPRTRRWFVWSGTGDGQNAVSQLSVLSANGFSREWSKVTTASSPTARGSCTAVFDGARRRILFGFGNTASERFTDLQVLELDRR